MITVMRRYRRTLQVGLLVIVAAFVASMFIFGSQGAGDGGRTDSIAVVNGESISYERYQRRYQAYRDAYSQIYRERFTPELAERIGMPQQVVNDLVQEALVVQRAKAEGIAITDDELNSLIHAIPAFQDSGRFSMKLYQEFLRRRSVTPASFEEDVRRELTRMKVQSAVRSGAKVSDAEVQQAYVSRNEEVRAAWVLIDLTPLVDAAQAPDAEVEKYLKEHGDEFRLPERRRIQYVTVNTKDFVRAAPEAEVEKYYKEHAAEFEAPHEVRAAHVLIRVPEGADRASEDKARAKAAEVIRRAKAGEDFAKLARELSDDKGSGQAGGDLGFFKKGDMVPQFEQAAFALKKGEITAEPVRSPFGFHAIRVTDIRDGGRKPLAAVSAQIREQITRENAERAAQARAEELRGKLQGAADFMAEAKKLGLAPVETTVARSEPVGGLGRMDPLEEAAFGVASGGVSTPIKTPVGFVVLKSVQQLPATVPPLADIKDKVTAAVKRQKAEAVALEKAKALEAEAKGADFQGAAKKLGALVGETARFSRLKPAERLPGDAMLAALRTPPGGVTEPIKAQQGYYLLKVLERVAPDPARLGDEREKLSQELINQKQSLAWESWLARARQGAKIQILWQPTSRRG